MKKIAALNRDRQMAQFRGPRSEIAVPFGHLPVKMPGEQALGSGRVYVAAPAFFFERVIEARSAAPVTSAA